MCVCVYVANIHGALLKFNRNSINRNALKSDLLRNYVELLMKNVEVQLMMCRCHSVWALISFPDFYVFWDLSIFDLFYIAHLSIRNCIISRRKLISHWFLLDIFIFFHLYWRQISWMSNYSTCVMWAMKHNSIWDWNKQCAVHATTLNICDCQKSCAIFHWIAYLISIWR